MTEDRLFWVLALLLLVVLIFWAVEVWPGWGAR